MSQARGQRRHDFRQGRQPAYVDLSRNHLNRILITPRPLPQIRDEIKSLRQARGAKRGLKSNAAIVTSGIITFGHDASDMFNDLPIQDQNAAFAALAHALATRLDTSLESLVVHLDETQIHAHFEMRAYDNAGHPLSQTTKPSVMSDLQDVTAAVLQRYCAAIERGQKKMDRLSAGASYPDTLNRSVKKLHQDLPSEIDAKEQVLRDLNAQIFDLQASMVRDEERIAKLEAREALNQKETKRLETYRKRLQKKILTMQEIEATQKAEAKELQITRRALDALTKENQAKAEELEIQQGQVKADQAQATAMMQKAKGARDAFEKGLVAQEAVLQEIADGTITQTADHIFLKDPAPFNAAPIPIRERLVRLMRQHLHIQSIQIRAMDRLYSLMDRMTKWLRRDDIPKEAREAAMEIKQDVEDYDM